MLLNLYTNGDRFNVFQFPNVEKIFDITLTKIEDLYTFLKLPKITLLTINYEDEDWDEEKDEQYRDLFMLVAGFMLAYKTLYKKTPQMYFLTDGYEFGIYDGKVIYQWNGDGDNADEYNFLIALNDFSIRMFKNTFWKKLVHIKYPKIITLKNTPSSSWKDLYLNWIFVDNQGNIDDIYMEAVEEKLLTVIKKSYYNERKYYALDYTEYTSRQIFYATCPEEAVLKECILGKITLKTYLISISNYHATSLSPTPGWMHMEGIMEQIHGLYTEVSVYSKILPIDTKFPEHD
jgi:hypothetical protein